MKVQKIQELLAQLEQLQSILIDVATGTNIRYEEDNYKSLYQEVDSSIEIFNEEGLAILNPNKFKSLWNWQKYYSSNELNSNARRKYIYEIYTEIINKIEDFLNSKNESRKDCIDNLEISFFQEISKKIELIKSIMIDVATRKSQVETEEENYIKIYQSIKSKISTLNKIGISIKNPNVFYSLSYWEAYSVCELNTYQLRREYVNSLYANIVSPIERALKRRELQETSLEEFIEDLKRYLSQQISIQISNPINQSQDLVIPIYNYQKNELCSSKDETQKLEDISEEKIIYNLSSREEKSLTVPTTTAKYSQSLFLDNVIDVVIITALEKERDAVLRYLDFPEKVQNFSKVFHRASVKTCRSDTTYQVVVICLNCMGNIRSALTTQRAIIDFNPSHIILTGIAGGIPKDSRYLGDILVGEQIVYYELGKQIQLEQNNSQIQRRYETHRPAKGLLEAAKNLPSLSWVLSVKAQRPDGTTGRVIPNVHFGVVASGDKVIADPNLRDDLQSDWSQMVGVEMEAAGAALAADESDFPQGILLVKGMCDWADGSKNDIWQEYAAESSASFVVELLKSAPFESKSKIHLPSKQEPVVEIKTMQETLKRQEQPQKIKSTKTYPGRVKLVICQRLVNDWDKLADYFDIKQHESATFELGKQPNRVWEWLEQRNKLDELEEALIVIGREDLVAELNE
ncbi:MAG: hypothetical protein KME64_18820 [Scytonematopsis contorta HA4267-MV1]|jgi:nucleoside phosphorylase|nr:hypothetical protein [Scytonematopsis contorta HA4267-MV1]